MYYGITISKSKLILNNDHRYELASMNIGVHEGIGSYILYYRPAPTSDNHKSVRQLKDALSRVRSEQIYYAYNDNLGYHDV